MSPVILLLCVGAAVALPAPQFVRQPNINLLAPKFVLQPNTNRQIEVINRQHEIRPSGEFVNNYESNDGQVVRQAGRRIPNNQNDDSVIAVDGSYSYTSPEGVPVRLDYTADQYGFRPKGNVLPQPVQPLLPTF